MIDADKKIFIEMATKLKEDMDSKNLSCMEGITYPTFFDVVEDMRRHGLQVTIVVGEYYICTITEAGVTHSGGQQEEMLEAIIQAIGVMKKCHEGEGVADANVGV